MSQQQQQLTPQQLREIENAFNKYDKDNSKSIDKEELKNLLETTLKTNLSQKMLEKYVDVQFQKNDKDKNQVIDFQEFVKLYTTLYFSPELPISMKVQYNPKKNYAEPHTNSPSAGTSKLLQKKPLSEQEKLKAKQTFDKFDLDKSGTIDRGEMSKLLESVYNENGKMSKLLFNRLVEMHMSKAGDDNVFSFDEFLNIYRNIFGEDDLNGNEGGVPKQGFVLPGM